MSDCTPGKRCKGEYVCDAHDGPEGWCCAWCSKVHWRSSTREPMICPVYITVLFLY